MGTKHTSGLWLASSVNALVEQHTTGRIIALCDVGKKHGQFRIDGEEVRANARLIAAAPELLEAARLLARTCEYQIRVYRQAGDEEGARMTTATLNMTLATIAKAEGRS